MSPPSHFPPPSSSPATGPLSSSAPNIQAQSAQPTIALSHSMSISSILGTGLPETPPNSRTTSFGDSHAAEAPQIPPPVTTSPTPPNSRNTSFGDSHAAETPQIPPPEFTASPVNDPALLATDAETFTPGAQLYSMRLRTDAIDDYEAITANVEDESFNAALTSSSNAAGKGKGKDPELYDLNPTEDGNSANRHGDRSKEECNAVESLVRLKDIVIEFSSVSILLNLGANARSPSRRSRSVSPSPVVKYEPDHLYSSESEDEGPPLPMARKRSFSTYCHGNHLQRSAHEGNAVFDLPLSSRRKQETRLHRQSLELHNGEMKCRRCGVAQSSLDARYVEGYRTLGCEGFEREDTVPLSDDALDHPRLGRFGAAEYDSEKHESEMLSDFPKLSQKTLERFRVKKWEYRSEPDALMVTSPDTSVSVTDVAEPIRLPLYAKDSTTRGSDNPSAIIDPEATASDSPPPSSRQRPSYTDRRSGASYPLASNFVDLTPTNSSPSPSARQARQKKPVTLSPLKQVQTAVESDHVSPSPEQHNLPTRPVSKRPEATQGKRGKPKFLQRAELTKEFIRMGVPLSTPQGKRKRSAAGTEAGPSTRTAPTPAPSSANGRKRKAGTQEVEEVEGQSPSQLQKKQKAEARPRTRAVERDDPLWFVNEEGEFEKRAVVESVWEEHQTAKDDGGMRR